MVPRQGNAIAEMPASTRSLIIVRNAGDATTIPTISSIFFFPHHYPLALAVNQSPAVYILSPALDYPGYQRFFLACDEELRRPRADTSSAEDTRLRLDRNLWYPGKRLTDFEEKIEGLWTAMKTINNMISCSIRRILWIDSQFETSSSDVFGSIQPNARDVLFPLDITKNNQRD